MRLVHIQTQIQSVFGVLDDDGNVIPQEPIVAQAPVFSEQTFKDAHEAIAKRRDEIVASEPPKPPPKPPRKQRTRPKR